MDKSRINQTELDYSCSVGEAKVNLFNGRLCFRHFDSHINSHGFRINLFHIYNSKFEAPAHIETFMGKKWKLNIQQFLYQDGSQYILIDENGISHTFKLCVFGTYYDTSGLGLVLNVNNSETVITDQANNKYYFENNRMIKKEAGYDSTAFEYYEYDMAGRLLTVYHSKNSNNKYNFEYENDILKSVTITENSNIKFQLKYYYTNYNCINVIEYMKENIIIEKVLFDYVNYNMSYAVLLSTNEALRFEYSYNKVTNVKKLLAGINEKKNENRKTIAPLNGSFCGQSQYIGDLNADCEYSHIIQESYHSKKIISINKISYFDNYTIVENEKQLKVVYYLNELGYTVSILEANNGNIQDLRSLEKDPGRTMLDDGTDTESINTRKAHVITTDYKMSTDNVMAESLENIDSYRGKKCANYNFFNCSFWLKLDQPLSNRKVNIVVKETKNDSGGVARADISIDNTAINSWQLVSVLIRIPFNKIKYFEVSFEDNNDSNTFKITDMRLCHGESTKLCVTNGSEWELLESIVKVKYIPINNPNEYRTIYLDEDTYITEKDLQFMYLDKFRKSSGNGVEKDYLMSFSNGTRRMMVKGVTLSTETKDFAMSFSSDKYGTNTRANFFYELKSPDENIYNYSFLHYFKGKKIDDKNYDCICQISEANKYLKSDRDHRESFTAVYYDLYGNLLLEQDEYGLKKSYKYDVNFNLMSKKIFHDEEKEQIEYNYETSNTNNTSVENNRFIKNEYDSSDGRIIKTIHWGKDEDASKEYIINNKYHDYSGRLVATSDNLGGANYIKYDQNGKVKQVFPTDYNLENAYGYEIGYDNFGSPSQFYHVYKSGIGEVKKLVLERETISENNLIKANYFRNVDEVDSLKIKLDKYGRTETVDDNGNITSFKRQNLWESQGNSEVEEMYDPFEKCTHHYDYDFFNNLKRYEIKKDDGVLISVSKESENSTKYEFDNNVVVQHVTGVTYDNKNLINPRITKTIDADDQYKLVEYGAERTYIMTTDYGYDLLGRLKNKKHLSEIEGLSIPVFEMSKTFSYKTGTSLKKSISYEISTYKVNQGKYEFDYEYNSRGLIEKQIARCDDSIIANYNNSYVYDKGNRLIQERNNTENKVIKYYYNNDGTLKSIEKSDSTIKYIYEYGRLKAINCVENSNMNRVFGYDNLGNCVNYNGNKLTWERIKLLKKFGSGDNEISYNYNNEGLLVEKLKGEESCQYIYEHGKLIHEKSDSRTLEYIYDKDEIVGFILYLKGEYAQVYYYVKDISGSVVAIKCNNNNEVAKYSYDSWGKVTLVHDDESGIGEINPIRWKSQYYDKDIEMYYITRRFYSPETTQFISPENVETILESIYSIYALNLYTLNVANPTNLIYNSNTIFENCSLENDPPELSGWSRFWQTRSGKIASIVLGVMALLVSIVTSIVFQQWWIFGSFSLAVSSSLAIGGSIGGLISMKNGDSFWRGFSNFINGNWSQTLAIESIITIVTCGISLLVSAIRNARPKGISKEIFKEAKKNGVKVKRANKVDFTDEAWEKINKLEHTLDGSTISDMKMGREIHEGYKADMIGRGKEHSVYNSRKRMDFFDKISIYELKPNNYKSAIAGIKQIKDYEALMGRTYRLVLVLY